MKILNEKSLGFEIKELYAFCAVDKDGEGIVGMITPSGGMPMVGADMARMESFRQYVKDLQKATGRKVKLKRFKLVSEEDV